jgi:hypothetical protein
VGHPGHELRVHHFLERARPLVLVVTDGSSRGSPPRLAASQRLLAATGASPGAPFGRWADGELYELVRRGATRAFGDLARDVAEVLVASRAALLVSDAPEGISLTHDLVAAVADAAVALARRQGLALAHHDFPLEGAPDACASDGREGALRLDLDEEAWARKREAAGRYAELRADSRRMLERYGADAFRVELLRPVARPFDRLLPAEPTAWERYGEWLARQGVYPEAIRWDRHVAPIVAELRALAAT